MSILKTGIDNHDLTDVENGLRFLAFPSVPTRDPRRNTTLTTITPTISTGSIPFTETPIVSEPDEISNSPPALHPINISDEIAQLVALEEYLLKISARKPSTTISIVSDQLIGFALRYT
jgi:hypothetical protein